MKKYLLMLVGISIISVAYAQTYSGGLPLPGIPVSLGQKTSANSTSVVLASDQSAVTISGSITATNPSVGSNNTTAPTSSTQIGYLDPSGNLVPVRGTVNGITVTALQGTDPWNVALGGGVVVSGGVAITNTPTVNQGTNPWETSVPNGVGITNTVTVNQGTSPWVTSIPNGVGITNTITAAISGDVVVSGGVAITSTVTALATTITRITNGVVSQTLAASNANRKTVFLYNDSATTACYVKFGATATTSDFTIKLFATDTYIMDPPIYTGVIDYICDAASGFMEVSEQ